MVSATEVDVLVVGAGFSGLSQLHQIRKRGLKVKVVEASSKIGGVWYWTNYPGFRVDTINPLYSLSINEVNKDWTWSEKFATRDEVLRYFEHMDKVLDFSKDVQLNTRVTSAEYDEASNLWRVATNQETHFISRFLILCVGIASRNYVPDIKGLDSFQGQWTHPNSWNHTPLDVKGKKVAVVGTGATGVQLVQEIGPQVSHLTIFQRTPNLCLPMNNGPLDASTQLKNINDGTLASELDSRVASFNGFNFGFAQRDTLKDTPEERRKFFEEVWARGWFNFWLGGYQDSFFNMDANREAYNFWAEKSRERIKDPRKRDLLAPLEPPHAFGTKRPSLESQYFEVCDQSNVDIVDTKASPIDHISSTSIVTKDGVEHGPFDIIVLATGYDIIRGSYSTMNIKGKGGLTLEKKWEDGIKTFLGLTSNGFPNFFFVYGPQAPTAFSNGPPFLEAQTKWVAGLIAHMEKEGKKKVEAKKEEEERWGEISTGSVKASLIDKTEGWYNGTNIPGMKREALCYLGGLDTYLGICRDVAAKGYDAFVFE